MLSLALYGIIVNGWQGCCRNEITWAPQPVEKKTVEAAVAMRLQKVVIECSASCYTEAGRVRINIWICD